MKALITLITGSILLRLSLRAESAMEGDSEFVSSSPYLKKKWKSNKTLPHHS